MFQNLEIFRMAHAMAVHAGTRQAVVAQNMANADTPGYAARDIPPFADLYGAEDAAFTLRATRPGHLAGTGPDGTPEVRPRRDSTRDPNGNSVSLESEMLRAVEVKRQHDRAITIYKSSLATLRAALGQR